MQDRLPNKPGRILITPEDGSAPFYATITRADEPLQEGDALNKANLLKDQTAARYGKGNNAVPDTIFDQIATELDRYAFVQAGSVKIETGSYIGTGNFGSENQNSLTFGFIPKLIVIIPSHIPEPEGNPDLGYTVGLSSFLGIFPNGCTYVPTSFQGSTYKSAYSQPPHEDAVAVTGWGTNTIFWYNTDSADRQLNVENFRYDYIVYGINNTGLDFDRLDYLTLLGDDEEETETTEEEVEA